MAKNLKINIKNAQLAEALKLNKLKKKKSAPAKKKVDAEEKEDAPKKRKVKATSAPKALSSIKPKAAKAENLPKKEPAPKEKAFVEEQAVEKQTVEKVPSAPKEKKIGYIRPGTEKKLIKETVDTKPVEKPKEKKELKPKQVEEEKPRKASQSKELKQYREYKEKPKGSKKGFQEQQSFDARDRQGLRSRDDGTWRKKRAPKKQKRSPDQPVVRPSELTLKLPISIKDLAAALKYKASELITKLFMQGITVTINDLIDDETTVELIGHEFGCQITIDTSEEKRLRITDKSIAEEIADEPAEALEDRAPVIAFMGHVDHGKTSLIDKIRKSNIASQESGAITQHIGAFRCKTSQGPLTILDTPGHEAFSAMRERGATVTDLVILVVAGDEGIKPQTDEAIKQAQAAGVPIVVAINKSDKPNFNAENIYRELADRNLLPEAWGGEIITVNCSATTGDGIKDLLEMLALQAEILELKANPKTRARGTVLESELRKGLGSTSTLLIQNGTLKLGDALVIKDVYGRIKTMQDEHGKNLLSAGPSVPVRISGLSGLPEAGVEFIVVESEREAKKLCIDREAGHKRELLKRAAASLESIMQKEVESQSKKILNVIVKADVQGSLDAIKTALLNINSKKAEVNIVSSGVGDISESDIELAQASNACILGFHTSVEAHAESMIKESKVQIENFSVIYHLIDIVKKKMVDLLDKIREEHLVGEAEVKAIFKSSQLGIIAGCQVADGIIKRSHYARLFRDDEEIWAGNLASIKRHQDDVKEVQKGYECGLIFENFKAVQVGDIVKSYEITYSTQELE